jgi:hypothetical protein
LNAGADLPKLFRPLEDPGLQPVAAQRSGQRQTANAATNNADP